MLVPSVRGVLELDSILEKFGSRNPPELTKSARGRPVLKLHRHGSTSLYTLNEHGTLSVREIETSARRLALGGITVEAGEDEVKVKTESGEFHGIGFLEFYGTSAYYVACRHGNCVAGIYDFVDDVTKIFRLKTGNPKSFGARTFEASFGRGCFSVTDSLVTLAVSFSGAEILPGHLKLVASCPEGNYFIDKHGFLVRSREGVLDVLGRFGRVTAAACLNYGLAIADDEGLKIVKYGAYTIALRDPVKSLSSHRDTLVATSKTGTVRVLAGGSRYALESPLLRACEATECGVVCLTDSHIIFLDPRTPRKVKAELREPHDEEGLLELLISPWYEGCHYTIAPRVIEVYGSSREGDSLRLALYPRALNWEGRVKVRVECPTYCHTIEESIRSGGISLEKVVERYVAIAKSGNLVRGNNLNCAGRVRLVFHSSYPLPVPIVVNVLGPESPWVKSSVSELHPGNNDVVVEFYGRCQEGKGVSIIIATDLERINAGNIAIVNIKPEEICEVRWHLNGDLQMLDVGSESILTAQDTLLRLYCYNGAVIEGYDSIRVENCEEPAVILAKKTVESGGFSFEMSSSKVLRDLVDACALNPSSGKVRNGGFYADCEELKVALQCQAAMKLEYQNDYVLSLYLNSSKIFEHKLEPRHLVTGLLVELSGLGALSASWDEIVRLALATASTIGRSLGGLIYGG